MSKFNLNDSLAVYNLSNSNSSLGLKVKDALNIIDEALETYGLNGLSLSFNGGKDCTVLLHLLAASVFRYISVSSTSTTFSTPTTTTTIAPSTTLIPKIKSVYVRCESPFTEVEDFVEVCVERYHLDLITVNGGMKEALAEYIDGFKVIKTNGIVTEEGGGIKAILVGTRRGDPHGALLTPFSPTDKDWPSFMRVHPILDWTYSEIWDFLREPTLTLGNESGRDKIEFCNLYDKGYTSLGSIHNTFLNPYLAIYDSTTTTTISPAVNKTIKGYKPAWDLKEESQERAGRGKQIPEVDVLV